MVRKAIVFESGQPAIKKHKTCLVNNNTKHPAKLHQGMTVIGSCAEIDVTETTPNCFEWCDFICFQQAHIVGIVL